MFSKFLASTTLALAFLSQVNAHTAIAPQLGVGAAPQRSDVKRPSTASPCGAGVAVAALALDSSTAVTAGADGSVTASAINFNGGADGSRKVTAKVDPTGLGKSFVAMTVTTNGDAAPTSNGPQAIVAQLPAGTKCTGGAAGNKCLVQFVTSAGFGNCVVVQQGAAAAAGGAAASGSAAAGAGAATGVKKGSGGAVTAGAAAKGANRAGGNKAAAGGAANTGAAPPANGTVAAAVASSSGVAATASNSTTPATGAAAGAAGAGAGASGAAAAGAAAKAGKKHHHKGAKKAGASATDAGAAAAAATASSAATGAAGATAAQAGTPAARALRLEAREAEVVNVVKRAFTSWMRS